MPLSPEDVAQLRRNAQRAKEASKPYRFFYCMADENDQPLLLIERLILPATIQGIRKTAKKKRFEKGTVSAENGQLVFWIKKPQNQHRFSFDLRTHFGREVALLKSAQVLVKEVSPENNTPEAPMSEAEKAKREALRAAKQRLSEAQKHTQQIRNREDRARNQIMDLVSRLVSSKEDWASLGFDSQQLASIVTDRRETLEANFGLLASFLESQLQLRLGDGELSDEEAQVVTDGMQSDVRREAYQELATELDILRHDMRDLAEEICFIDSAIAQCEAEEAVAVAECEEARAATVRATRTLHIAEDRLEERLASLPASERFIAEARLLEQDAELLVDDAVDLQVELAEMKEDREALLQSLREQGADADPKYIIGLAMLEEQILTRESELEVLVQQADTIRYQLKVAQADAYGCLEANGDNDTVLLMQQVVQSQQVVASLTEQESIAEAKVSAVADQTAERNRQRAVAPLLNAATTWMQRSMPVVEVMEDLDPRDPETIRRKSILMIQPGVFNILSDGQHHLKMLTQAGARDTELEMVFGNMPAAWRPTGYDEILKTAQEQAAWGQHPLPLQEQLQQLEDSIQAGGLVPDVQVPEQTDELQEKVDAFRRLSPEQDARLEDAQIAMMLKAHLSPLQDPDAAPDERAAATTAILSIAREQPRSAIAWLAQSGDPVAQKIACGSGLSEEKLAQVAPPVALQALLRYSLDGERLSERFEPWLSGLETSTEGLFSQLKVVLQGWLDAMSSNTRHMQIDSIPEDTFSGLQHVFAQLRSKRVRVKEQEPNEASSRMLQQLDASRVELCDQVARMRVMTVKNLKLIGSLQAQDDRKDTIAMLLEKNLELLQKLATVG